MIGGLTADSQRARRHAGNEPGRMAFTEEMGPPSSGV